MKKTLLSLVLAVALLLCALCICSCSAQNTGDMAGSVFSDDSEMKYYNNCYLKLDGIEGEADDSKHDKWIEVVDFEMGSTSVKTDDAATSYFEPFVFVHKVDKATPKIQRACMTYTSIKTCTLEVCRAFAGKQEAIYKATFDGLRIVSAQISKDEAGNMIETVSIVPNKITWKVVPVNSDSTLGTPVEESYSTVSKS